MKFATITLSVVSLFACGAAPPSASAAIWCDGEFQIVNGSPVGTPFCENHLLAQVARSYGAHTSADYLANSLSEKQQICNFVGFDWRVENICAPYRNGPGGPHRR